MSSSPRKRIQLDLPLIINGREYPVSDFAEADLHTLQYETGISVRLPKLAVGHVDLLKAEAKEIDAELRMLSMPDIIAFLGKVGELWDARKLRGRMLVRSFGHLITQFSDIMMERDYETMGHFLAQRWHLYDQLESEFGDQRIFDEWIPVQMTYRKAFPRGLVLHYLVGNLPVAAMYSLIRGMGTKNRTIAKLPTRDPVTPIGLAQAIIEVDAQHPISRSLTLAYWPHNDPVGDDCIRMVDAACVWGGAQAVESVKAKLPANIPLAEYGPKWSAAAVDLTSADVGQAAMRIIEDSCFYDQEACFNTQRVYVKGDIEPFIEELRKAASNFGHNLPFVSKNRDTQAQRTMALLEAQFQGLRVINDPDWSLVVLPKENWGLPHPLSRTLFLHPVSELAELTPYLNRDSQTLSVYPKEVMTEYRDEWAAAGTDRIVEAGFARMPRAGFTHDAMLGMHTFVRLVTQERSWDDPGRYYTRREDPAQHYLVDRYEKVRGVLAADPPLAEVNR